MKSILLAATALFLGLALGLYLGSGSLAPAHAQGSATYFLDSSWGSVKGTMGNRMLVLEDKDGVIRLVDLSKFNVSSRELEVDRTIERR